MAQALRKQIILTVLGEDHAVDVDYRLLETLERAFAMGAVDVLIPVLMNPEKVQRGKVADVVCEIIGPRVAGREGSKVTRADLREAVFTMEYEDFSAMVLHLFAAVAFSVKRATAAEFDKCLAAAAPLKKKPPSEGTASPPVSSPTATSSP